MKRTPTKQNHGFTIIEVMIVLAIAGLILAIVFLAVPALQRNARNNSRRNDVSHFIGLINEYEANNNGQLPTQIGTGSGQLNISSENWAIMSTPTNASIVVDTSGCTTGACNSSYGSVNNMIANEGFLCTNNQLTATNASSHSFAVGFYVETSGSPQQTCVSG